MNVGFKKSDFVIIILSIIGLFLFFYLFPKLYPGSNLNFTFSKQEIINRGISVLKDFGYTVNKEEAKINIYHDNDQIRYLNRVFGSERTNRIINDSIPVYYWDLSWPLRSDTTEEVRVVIESGSDREIVRSSNSVVLHMDLQGRPLSLESDIEFDADKQSSLENNFTIAQKYANKFFKYHPGRWIYDKPLDNTGGYTRNNIFKWHLGKRVAGEYVTMVVNFKEGGYRSINIKYNIPKNYSTASKDNEWVGIISVVIILFFIVLVVIHFIRRLRSDMIDLKRGIILGIIVALGYAIFLAHVITVISHQSILEALIAILVVTPFIGAGLWILYSIGLAISRDVWSDKLFILDTIKKKKLFPSLGRSILRGLLLIFIILGAVSVIEYAGVNYLSGYFRIGGIESNIWSSTFPSVLPLIGECISSFYIVTALFLFFAPIIKQRFSHHKWVVIILALTSMFLSLSFPHIYPIGLSLMVNLIIGLILVLFFIKYDYPSLVVGSIGIPVFYYGTVLMSSEVSFYIFHGIILYAFIGLLILYAILSFFTEPPSEEETAYVPPYLKRVYERERIQRELEIARDVQASFLPKEKPKIKGIDVASLCLPAKEVGGDYFDFVEMGKNKLGVAIGDVSGKGTSAAFYMTLTKGFFKSQAKYVDSPMQVLINMNELFYDNVERGVFISMIYSIFDLEKKKMTFSRAGHNPMILRRSGKGMAEEISPPGIALGLEKGEIFSRTIEQKTIPIHSGDVFLFYTDGLNEAINASNEEYGETRLRLAVEKNSHLPIEVLLDNIEEDIYYFTGRAPQYDDMTAVVIKIK